MQVAFERIGRRIERIELADDNEFRYFPSFMLRGLTGLRVRMIKAANANADQEMADV